MNSYYAYFGVTLAFTILGAYLVLLFRWWYRHLIALAARFDIKERHQRAGRRALGVMPLFFIPLLSVLVCSIELTSVNSVFVFGLFILQTAPALIWYRQRLPELRSLGYYGGQPKNEA